MRDGAPAVSRASPQTRDRGLFSPRRTYTDPRIAASPLDELLAAVDVEGRAGDRRVGHEVNGE